MPCRGGDYWEGPTWLGPQKLTWLIAEPVLPLARGHFRGPLRPEDRYLVAGLHPGRAVHRQGAVPGEDAPQLIPGSWPSPLTLLPLPGHARWNKRPNAVRRQR